MQPILSAQNVKKRFAGISVLNGVSMDVPRGKITALIGSNGAGKSTFLNLISGFLSADEGRLELRGHDITRLPPYKRARLGLARSFQHPRTFRSLSVLESVALGATRPSEESLANGLWSAVRDGSAAEQARFAAAEEYLRLCRLDSRKHTPAADLSYGERKLLMLAQIMALGGELFCFDELCAGLEEDLAQEVARVFRHLVENGKTVLFIEHNLQLVRTLADHVVFLHLGTVYREGETLAVLEDPEVVRLYLGQ